MHTHGVSIYIDSHNTSKTNTWAREQQKKQLWKMVAFKKEYFYDDVVVFLTSFASDVVIQVVLPVRTNYRNWLHVFNIVHTERIRYPLSLRFLLSNCLSLPILAMCLMHMYAFYLDIESARLVKD